MQRPRPVLTSAGIAGAVHAVAVVLGFLGYTNAETSLDGETQTIVAIALFLVTAGAHVVAGLHAQQRVTPLDSPRDNSGTTLVPITDILTPDELAAAQAEDDAAQAPPEDRYPLASFVASIPPGTGTTMGGTATTTATYSPQHAAGEAVITDAPSTDAGSPS